jgi:hypothetical protein
MLVQDATRFLLQHYPTIATWPLQIYSSAIVFSPQTSVVRRNNLDKLPMWLRKFPQMEDSWASLIRTLGGDSGLVCAIAFSLDGSCQGLATRPSSYGIDPFVGRLLHIWIVPRRIVLNSRLVSRKRLLCKDLCPEIYTFLLSWRLGSLKSKYPSFFSA